MLLVDEQELYGWLPPWNSYVSITGISGMETGEGFFTNLVFSTVMP